MDNLKSIIESILFIHGEPIKISKIAKVAGISKNEAENALEEMKREYSKDKRGMVIVQKNDEVQFATNPENSSLCSQLVKEELQGPLSQASLETLSIIAYRGPITRNDIEAIRGVNSTYTLRNLLLRGLVERTENPKFVRGYLYSASFDFLKQIGIESPEKLPDFEKLKQDDRIKSMEAINPSPIKDL